MKHLRIYEENGNLIPKEYADFIRWISKNSESSTKRKFAYNIHTDKWLDLKDYETYYTLDELFIKYKSEKYNI